MKRFLKKLNNLLFQLWITSIFVFISCDANALADNPFFVKAYGNFSNIIHAHDAHGQISLPFLQGKKGLYGLGALEGLHGEVEVINGKVLVTPGTTNDGHVREISSKDHAALLATGVAKSWVPIHIPPNTSQASFEAFLLKESSKLGIPKNVPFPFMVKGEIKNLIWHVVIGFNSAPKIGHSNYPAKKEFKESSVKGILLGFYTSKQFEGVISHPNECFHIHFADSSFTYAGHAETFEIGSGATLFLPKSP